jgi:hypothetical protein
MADNPKPAADSAADLLNEAAIRQRRVPAAVVDEAGPGSFICHFCSRRFRSETLFLHHVCEQRRRQQLLLSPVGQAAYGYYRAWMRARRFKDQSSAAFMESRYFRMFLKFAEWAAATKLAQPERYIELMVARELQPALWCRPETYRLYVSWLEEHRDPVEQVKETLGVIKRLAEQEGVPPGKLLEHLGSQRVLGLIAQHQLSPWFLLHSSTFKQLVEQLSPEERLVFTRALNAEVWQQRFKALPNIKATREQLKQLIREEGL